MSDKTQEIKDAIAESIGDVVQSITTLVNNRASHKDDNNTGEPGDTGNDTDDNNTGDVTGKNKPTDDEIGKRAIDQYINAQKDDKFTGKTL